MRRVGAAGGLSIRPPGRVADSHARPSLIRDQALPPSALPGLLAIAQAAYQFAR